MTTKRILNWSKKMLFCGLLLTAMACGKKAAAWKVGDKVQVKSGKEWLAGTILSAEADDKYKIHYDGAASNWDEMIGGFRLRNSTEGKADTLPAGMAE